MAGERHEESCSSAPEFEQCLAPAGLRTARRQPASLQPGPAAVDHVSDDARDRAGVLAGGSRCRRRSDRS